MRELLKTNGINLTENTLQILDRFSPTKEELEWQKKQLSKLKSDMEQYEKDKEADLIKYKKIKEAYLNTKR